jgi:methanogenic corrinoid protein MtbC1
MQPAAYTIGELWQQNEISIGQEHVATAIMERQLGALHAHSTPPRSVHRSIVLGCVVGELHRMGSRIVANAFEAAGWRVVYLGADVPVAEFVQIVEQERPDLVGLSAHSLLQREPITQTVAALREAGLGGIPILVGGLPFVAHPEFAKQVGAHGVACDAADAVRQAERLLAGTYVLRVGLRTALSKVQVGRHDR